MTKRSMRLLAAASVVMLAALQTSCDGRRNFDNADTNDDDKVSRSEFKRYMLEHVYGSHDHNGDKQVTLNEWKRKNRGEDEKRFSSADRNGDDVVTPDELKKLYYNYGTLDELFRKIDSNRDGYLTFEEISEFKAANK